MKWLGFVTGYSFLDVWTAVHTSFWIFIGSTLWAFKISKRKAVIGCLLFSLLWEVIEAPLAHAYPRRWLDPESLWNAWLSDPLTSLVGVLLIWWMLDHRPRR